MSMSDRMKERAILATAIKRSDEVVKTISKADSIELFRQLEPIFAQNRREYNFGLAAIEKNGFYYKGESTPMVNSDDSKQQKLVKKL